MFKVITVTSEYGAGASIIAQRVAEILGWTLLDRSLIAEVARATGVDTETVMKYDERVDSWWRRFNRGGLRAAAIQAGMPITDAEFFDSETIAGAAQRVIVRAAAAGNCVIVGRGAQCILQDRDNVYHVFIYAPWGERLSRVRGRAQSSTNAAELIRLTDQERAGYIRTYYGSNWKDPHLYQMMMSSQAGIENAACMIVEAVLRGSAADFAAAGARPARHLPMSGAGTRSRQH